MSRALPGEKWGGKDGQRGTMSREACGAAGQPLLCLLPPESPSLTGHLLGRRRIKLKF